MSDDRQRADGHENPLARLRTAESGPLAVLRETLLSIVAVTAIGLLLTAISGTWPPLVAVESGSMEPHMHKGDMVFMTAPDRFAPEDELDGTGVVTAEIGRGDDYRTFGGYGSVIVYRPPGYTGSPIIHRAHFWVEEGENWYEKANPEYVRADNCRELPNCPAPYAGFITKGDANPGYDQTLGISGPVRPEWIVGVSEVRLPYIGWVRLIISSATQITVDCPGCQTNTLSEHPPTR